MFVCFSIWYHVIVFRSPVMLSNLTNKCNLEDITHVRLQKVTETDNRLMNLGLRELVDNSYWEKLRHNATNLQILIRDFGYKLKRTSFQIVTTDTSLKENILYSEIKRLTNPKVDYEWELLKCNILTC